MRYIGGKRLLLEDITKAFSAEPEIKSVLDIFSGSGVVSAHLKNKGYNVMSNDLLYFSYVLARGTIGINTAPTFPLLPCKDVVRYLNELTIDKTNFSLEDCFIYNTYSSNEYCDRMYFQTKNAIKIDIIRLTIEDWKKQNLLSDDEYFYLLAMLINAVPYVSNITGVYSSYLKFWDKRTYNELTLIPPVLTNSDFKPVCFNMDYTSLLKCECDLLYADPPYNAREYLPNYHLLETIARYDYPVVRGVTGMRSYDELKSVFCKKSTVHTAFEVLVRDSMAKYILISYNNEALLSSEELTDICRRYAVQGSFRLIEKSYRRYKNKIPNNAKGLMEQLYFLRRR